MHPNKLGNQAIELVAMGPTTDYPDAFTGCSAMDTIVDTDCFAGTMCC